MHVLQHGSLRLELSAIAAGIKLRWRTIGGVLTRVKDLVIVVDGWSGSWKDDGGEGLFRFVPVFGLIV
jgi:hypothetical protein